MCHLREVAVEALHHAVGLWIIGHSVLAYFTEEAQELTFAVGLKGHTLISNNGH